jgi:hypothetical protein
LALLSPLVLVLNAPSIIAKCRHLIATVRQQEKCSVSAARFLLQNTRRFPDGVEERAMQNSTILAQSSLLNHLTTIKMALALLEWGTPFSRQQLAVVQRVLTAADELVTQRPRS